MKIPNILQKISQELKTKDSKAIIVGGSVRDFYLKKPMKDYDIEVYGLHTIDELEKILKQFGKVKLVGKSFGVLKFIHDGFEYDFAFPRTEVKSGAGHKGFEVVSDGFMSYEDAAKRRDFTINAMGYGIENCEFLDPFDGLKDMDKKILRHIDDKTFIEDPLRVYRGIQFCARLEYEMADSTKKLCKSMVSQGVLQELPKERVFEEFKKLLLKAKQPSIGFKLMDELGVLKYFSDINHEWDKLDRLATYKNIKILLACLTSHLEEDKVENFITVLSDEVKLINEVKKLVKAFQKVQDRELDDIEIRRLSTKVDMSELATLCEDESILNHAKKLGVDKKPPSMLLQGKDLLALGYKPSSMFSKILSTIYELQLTGEISEKEEALNYVRKHQWQ